ncbi:MAG: signal peptidase I [Betaproteobacteria bacterium]|nr:signal peptidase I [Betaproteobacteria bacterium]
MNFAVILFVLLVVTGLAWFADRLVFRKRRPADGGEPWWVEYGASFFPVILVVFLLRSFVIEPFKIPSGSMIPTLLVGDFIFVNKFTWGIRLPIVNTKIIEMNEPKRGDVMVFRYPENPSLDYIKRVVGLPGDTIEYINKHLLINGKEIPHRRVQDYLHRERLYFSPQYVEQLGEKDHAILVEDDSPAFVPHSSQFPFKDNCHYNSDGLRCQVPKGHFFVMGDNRDASSDSRVWGFVPEHNIVGRAFLIWFNFSDLKRVGGFS